ncbi:MAG: LytR/AlgR family response regulator transcription factor [Bacteroidales bacterium]
MKEKLNYVVIDDDILAHKALETLVGKYDFLECVGSCYDAFAAISILAEKKPDMLFLDIEMPGMTGMELLSIIDKSIKVIVTSCSSNYAVDTYLYPNVVGYLKKPIRDALLCKTLSNVLHLSNSNEAIKHVQTPKIQPLISLTAKGSNGNEVVYLRDVVLFKSIRNYVNVIRDNNITLKYDASLKRMAEMLPPNDFIRINRSIIISIQKIKSRRDNKVELIGNIMFTIGDNYIEHFNNKYKEL